MFCSELIHLGAQVMATGGTIDAFIQAVYNYPTLSEAYMIVGANALPDWSGPRCWVAASRSPTAIRKAR